MEPKAGRRCTAFEGTRRIAAGEPLDVALAVKEVVDRGERAPVLVLDDETAEPLELDLRGTADDVRRRLTPDDAPMPLTEEAPRRGPGRPRLGVVAREVTLLPRHWEWLARQPGGASVALRKLVEEARRSGEATDRARRGKEVVYRFMSTMAGNEPGFEEATRALFAGDRVRFEALVAAWPPDVREHATMLAAPTFAQPGV